MKKLVQFLLFLFLYVALKAQISYPCIKENTYYQAESTSDASPDIIKTIRINIHFMLTSEGEGNFRENDDGDGRADYNGYLYAKDLTKWMNEACAWNEQMILPYGNQTPVMDKNYRFVLDAVYFWRDDAGYNFSFSSYEYDTYGKNKSNVFNIFLTYDTRTKPKPSGYALALSPFSKVKYTKNRAYWQDYKNKLANNNPFEWFLHSTGNNTLHEIGHLTGLKHTLRWYDGVPCPVGCGEFDEEINPNCDDGCSDTPTAWEIAQADPECKHPACGWNMNNEAGCGNNLMDYTGRNALTPCQINTMHVNLENGLTSYLLCDALSQNLSVCDIGYPVVSYFGKVLTIGCPNTMAEVSNKEGIDVYYSESVELNNFEIDSNSEFEVILSNECTF